MTLAVHKGLPLSGGQGGSAASAIAAAVAVNQLVVKCDTMPDAKVLKLFAADVLLLVKK